MGSRIRRALLWGAVGLGVLVVAGAAGFAGSRAYLRRSLPLYDDTASVAVRGHVRISRDSFGIPSITAGDLHDLVFGLGYVHAQDRLWQMEMARRAAEGRLAEAFGPDLLEADRFLRTIGFWRAVLRADSALAGEVRALLQGYADGVNAGMASLRAWPPEFVLLRLTPEPWTILHSLAITQIMTWDLTEWDLSLSLARAVERVGPDLARELFPRVREWSPRIMPSAPRRRVPAVASIGPQSWPAGALPEVPASLRPLLESFAIARASNSWVIGPSRSRSGKPILANDMHLALRAPPPWYLAALHGPGFDVVGMTLPGAPGIVAGHSRRVAWGYTAAYVDNIDFFVEEFDPADSTRVRTPAGWETMTFHEETIHVRARNEPVVVRVAETRHGPVLTESETKLAGTALSMQWTGARPGAELRAILWMNLARNVTEFVDALRDFANPQVNVVFADADGRIGYWLAGSVPVRRSGDGVLPAPGASGEYDWIGFVPFDSLPHVLDPPSGYIVTANNIPRDGGPFIGAHFDPGYRAARIAQLIEATRTHDVTTAHAIQLDVHSLFAARHRERAAAAARAAGLEEVARLLEDWDGDARMEDWAPAVFYTWVEHMRRAIASDEYGGSLGYFPWEVLDEMIRRGTSPWFDDGRTPEPETLEAVSVGAMKEAVRFVPNGRWGAIHTLTSRHTLGARGWLNTWLGLNVGPYPAPGDPFTVNAAHHVEGGPPFRVQWGVSQRHVVDMADPDGAGGFVLPTGQSGNPLSPHYRDQVERWRGGGLRPILLDRDRARARARHETVLVPNGER